MGVGQFSCDVELEVFMIRDNSITKFQNQTSCKNEKRESSGGNTPQSENRRSADVKILNSSIPFKYLRQEHML